jgi:hypothetical protein
MELTNISTNRILEDAIRHLADARLARDPLARLTCVIRVQRELADAMSGLVSDLVIDAESTHAGAAGGGDAA